MTLFLKYSNLCDNHNLIVTDKRTVDRQTDNLPVAALVRSIVR